MQGSCVKPPISYRSVGTYYAAAHFPEEVLRSALSYKPHPGDVFIVTYPKCGTTWMQYIVHYIYTNGAPITSVEDFLRRQPWLERVGAEGLTGLPRPGSAIKSHMPYDQDRVSKHAKYIYVARNPYDCCVSFFNHFKHFPVHRFEDGTFEEFFELFMLGEVDFGSYFDHLLSWYGHRDEPNVLFMTYEDLKQDTRFWIQKVADFLGSSYGESLRHSPEAMERIVEETGVANLRRLVQMERNYQRKVLTDTPRELLPRWAVLYLDVAGDMLKRPLGGDFVRKGVVGDWRNYFTAEQTERMKRKVQDECQGTDIMQLWKHLDIC
ncbi:amine sulfotransferase [Ixodes scapularis]|uniref:amine sulfotransferase n=1 Tax=Ixodes scapularis TaxID=6945 RepID=UPI001A9D9038|nr:amine sulfotransferase [Ixodes scapularis]